MRKLALLIITFLSSIFGQAQVTETPVKLEDALLWEISGNGLQEPSYLLGAMHLVGDAGFIHQLRKMRYIVKSGE